MKEYDSDVQRGKSTRRQGSKRRRERGSVRKRKRRKVQRNSFEKDAEEEKEAARG